MEAEEAQLEVEWEKQMREVAERENSEKYISRIPDKLKDRYILLMPKLSIQRRFNLLNLLNLLDWTYKHCLNVILAIDSTPDDMRGSMVDLFFMFVDYPDTGLPHAILLLSKFSQATVLEIFHELSTKIFFAFVMETTRHLEDYDLDNLVYCIHNLGLRAVLGMLKNCESDPKARACGLCRTRKRYKLHQRLCDDQVPNTVAKVAGALEVYDKNQSWNADDEFEFRFDFETSEVFWGIDPVDLVAICLGCLSDMYRAICSVTRYKELFHLDPVLRQQAMSEMKKEEANSAKLFAAIQCHVIRRQCRGYSIAAVRTARHMKRQEADREAVRLEHAERARQEAAAEAAHANLISSALGVDVKWRRNDQQAVDYDLNARQVLSELNYHVGYNEANPMSRARRRPHSWSLADFDTDKFGRKIPLSPRTAIQSFAIADAVNRDDLTVAADEECSHTSAAAVRLEPVSGLVTSFASEEDAIREWKSHAIDLDAERRAREAEVESLRRKLALDSLNQQKALVRERMAEMNAKERQRRAALEFAEFLRVQKRREDREERRRLRIAGYEADERRLMRIEDDWSRAYNPPNDKLIARLERALMFAEETLQRSLGDGFWGWEIEERRRLAEMLRRKRWEDRVEQMRRQCVLVKVIKPSAGETVKEVLQKHFKQVGTANIASTL